MVSWIDVTENRHVGRRIHLRPKDTLAEVTFPSNNAAEYIEHAQFLAMDYSNMLTAVAVRNDDGHNISALLRARYLPTNEWGQAPGACRSYLVALRQKVNFFKIAISCP